MIRTLPIRLEPTVGESLTSWLCALAGRNQVTWHQILTAVGLHRRPRDMKRLGWASQLHPSEIADLAISTGIDADILTAMTFAHLESTGITTGRRPRRPFFGADHSRRPVQYCPRCLLDSGGRWQLRWSLGWSFACIEHGCLLSDVCPQCGRRPQRRTPYAHHIPDLTACSQPAPSDPAGKVCGADLRHNTEGDVATGEMIDAQRTIDAVVAGTVDGFGIYGARRVTTRQILLDLRGTASRVLANVDRCHLADLTRGSDCPMPPAPGPARTAVAFTAAVDILHAPDIAAGAALLRPRLAVRAAGLGEIPQRARSRDGISAGLAAVHLGAVGPHLCAGQQLRYRTHTSFPRAPRRPETTLAKVCRSLPTLIWTSWARQIIPAAGTAPVIRAALSCAVALVGTDADIDVAARLLGAPGDPCELSAVLERLPRDSEWIRTAATITALADLLGAQKTSPIDYHRRRQIDYTALLSDDQWLHLQCDLRADIESRWGANPARCALFAHLSGLPISHAPWFVDDSIFRATCTQLADLAAKDAGAPFTAIADQFLSAHGINEPSFSQPDIPGL